MKDKSKLDGVMGPSPKSLFIGGWQSWDSNPNLVYTEAISFHFPRMLMSVSAPPPPFFLSNDKETSSSS